MIELRELRLAFGPRAIFDNVSAVVNKGDKIGLVGSNGAGKTTLLKILAGIESPDSGEVAKPGYATVGYLPQESLVAGRFTTRRNPPLRALWACGKKSRRPTR